MKKYLILGIIMMLFNNIVGIAQEATQLATFLLDRGMEHIRVREQHGTLYASFEDCVNRYPWQGLEEVIRFLRASGIENPVSVNLESKGQPRVNMRIDAGVVSVTNRTEETVRILGKERPASSPFGKLQITALPFFALRNARTDVLMTVSAGIVPTLDMQLWPGASLTLQGIIPIYNSMEEQWDHVRPGLVTLNQHLRLNNNWSFDLAAGNFTGSRAGVHGELNYASSCGLWGARLSGGLTGSSTMWDGELALSQWRRIDAHAGVWAYWPRITSTFALEAGRYVRGDYGACGSLTRQFGLIAVRLYAMVSGGEANGGFGVVVPLCPVARKRVRPVSLTGPRWYDWTYSAQAGPDYVRKGLGTTYKTRLYEEAESLYWNPAWIEARISKTW